jgi:hypothetical protein
LTCKTRCLKKYYNRTAEIIARTFDFRNWRKSLLLDFQRPPFWHEKIPMPETDFEYVTLYK